MIPILGTEEARNQKITLKILLSFSKGQRKGQPQTAENFKKTVTLKTNSTVERLAFHPLQSYNIEPTLPSPRLPDMVCV